MIIIQDLYSLSLNDITPPNIAQDSQVSSLISALDPELQELSALSLEPLILARIDELPENVIDLLAWQLHVDFYDLSGTLYMKREAVKGSILWHMHKGTKWAIMEALRLIDIKAEFVHWHDDNSTPYTFTLRAIVSGEFYRTKGKDQLQSAIRRAVDESKAARSYLAGLETTIEFNEDIGLFVGTIPFLTGYRRILLPKPRPPETSFIYSGIATLSEGQQIFRLPHEAIPQSIIFHAPLLIQNIDLNFGVDLLTMQELLAAFEQRLLARIDASERNMIALINSNQLETSQKLDDIKAMLLWKSDLDEDDNNDHSLERID